MSSTDQITFTIVISTVLFLVVIAIVVLLLVINSNSRQRYRAELAEKDLEHAQEVILAEREATEQTLGEMGRELHDNVGQLLTVAQMGLLNRLEPSLLTDEELAVAMDALDEGIEEVRKLGHSLNKDLWQERTLKDAIETEAGEDLSDLGMRPSY